MKKIFIITLLLSIYVSISLAQDTMFIHQNNGSMYKFAISQIDSIVFYSSGNPGPTVTDIDGNVYNIVTIGSQEWIAQNLKTTHFNDGTPIPLATGNDEWRNLTTSGYCWYNNDEANYKDPYGAIYNWYAVDNGNLCPEGWHVPGDAEWTILTDYLGGLNVTGGKLKETGTTHWNSPNYGATNETGFTALPGGERSGTDGSFQNINENGYWWSADENFPSSAWYRQMTYNSASVIRHHLGKDHGRAVRCLKD